MSRTSAPPDEANHDRTAAVINASLKARRTMTVEIDVCHANSALNKSVLTRLVRRQLKNPGLRVIEERRAALAALPAYPAHPVYGDSSRTLRPEEISLPASYGHVLYSLARHTRPGLVLESGAGFGVSGLYLSLALTRNGGALRTFEIGDYWTHARQSLDLMKATAVVHHRPFEEFAETLTGDEQVDFAFIDAVHAREVVVRSVRSLIGWMRPGGLIVLDDVELNESMRDVWPLLAQNPFISMAARINRRLGVLEVRET